MPGQTDRPTLDYAVVCDDVRFEMGGRISLMGLFDAIEAQRFPTVHPRLAVVAAWLGFRGEAQSEIELVDPAEMVLGKLGVTTLKETGEKKGARHIAVSYNLPLKVPGIYQVRIYLDRELVRSIALPVRSAGTQGRFENLGKLPDMR